MNSKTIAITLSIIGGLIGLGLIADCLVKEPLSPEPDEKLKEPSAKEKQFAQKPGPAKPVNGSTEAPVGQSVVVKHDTPVAVTKDETKNDSKEIMHAFVPDEKKEQEKPDTKLAMPLSDETPTAIADEFPLRIGSQGPRVERLQVFLLRNYGHTGKVTGLFDEHTAAELKRRLNKTALDEPTYQKYRMGKHVHEQVIIR